MGGDGRGDRGVRFDRLNELRGETGKDLEPVEGSGMGGDGRGNLGVRFDRLNELRGETGKVLELVERPGGEGRRSR